jgi:hypothetical protein
MGKPVDVAGAEDKTAAQLERVSAEFVLRMARGFGAGASLCIVASQHMKQICPIEFHSGIGFAFFVNEQRKGDARLLPKSACVDAISQSHCRQVRSTVVEGLFVRAQLRDVLAAENSTVMTKENHDRWLANPQRTDAKLSAVTIGKGNHGKPAVEGSVHCTTFRIFWRYVNLGRWLT